MKAIRPRRVCQITTAEISLFSFISRKFLQINFCFVQNFKTGFEKAIRGVLKSVSVYGLRDLRGIC